jgi:hypothetical protein
VIAENRADHHDYQVKSGNRSFMGATYTSRSRVPSDNSTPLGLVAAGTSLCRPPLSTRVWRKRLWPSLPGMSSSTISPSRAARFADAELEGLYAVLVSLGLTKRMAGRLMRDFPRNGTAGQVTVNFVTDGEGDISVTVAHLGQGPSSSQIP